MLANIVLLLCLGAPVAGAQNGNDMQALEDAMRIGVRAFEAGNTASAIKQLGEVVSVDSGYASPRRGTAAYWLGRAYMVTGDAARAVGIWRAGLRALDAQSRFAPRLADTFIRRTFSTGQRADYPQAVSAYQRLLSSLDFPVSEEAWTLVAPYLEALVPILPEPERQATGLIRRKDISNLESGAGARLLTWWRSRDPAPGTRNNEALEAHLERFAYAFRYYRRDGGFDDRGMVYIRLGPPSRKTSVKFDRTVFREKVLRRNLTLSDADYPENELWVYERLGRDAQYLFVDDRGYFRIGEPNDLLPRALRNGLSNSARGAQKSEAVIRSIEEIYAQLSLFHPLFATRYTDVTDFVGQLDARDIAQGLENMRQLQRQNTRDQSIDEGAGKSIKEQLASRTNTNPGMGFNLSTPPHVFAQSEIMQASLEDHMAAMRRKETVPLSFVDVMGESETLPIFVRIARFLESNGATRTEIYWGISQGGIVPSKSAFKRLRQQGYNPPLDLMLIGTVAQKTGAYQERVVNYHRKMVRKITKGKDQLLLPQTYAARGDTGLFHLALQWDLYAVPPGRRPMRMGPRVKMTTYRVDSLRALNPDTRNLEMSDLKPLIVRGDRIAMDLSEARTAVPYPYAAITPQTPLALYFEVYHLNFGGDDRTHYTVQYEMIRTRQQRKGLFLKKRTNETSTSAGSAYSGDHRTAPEVVVLDLNGWEDSGELEIRVRISDDVTGQQAERSLNFSLTAGDK